MRVNEHIMQTSNFIIKAEDPAVRSSSVNEDETVHATSNTEAREADVC